MSAFVLQAIRYEQPSTDGFELTGGSRDASEARYQGLSRPGLSSLEGRRLTGLVPGSLWNMLVDSTGRGCGRSRVSGPFGAQAVPVRGGRSLWDLSLLHSGIFLAAHSVQKQRISFIGGGRGRNNFVTHRPARLPFSTCLRRDDPVPSSTPQTDRQPFRASLGGP